MVEGRTRKVAACALVGAVAFLAGSGKRVVRAENCQPSRLLVILDKSSSMLGEITEGQSKWVAAVTALEQVTGAYQDTMQIGLSTFPAEGQCSPGRVDVVPNFGSSAAIVDALAEPPPDGGNWTPMAETLDAALGFDTLNEPDVPSYVVLITDGWQWCHPYDDATRFLPVDAVERLAQAGITTFVVGFGEGVDPPTLNQMAVMAGTDRPSCDPTGTTVDSPDPCYYQADNPLQLIEALTTVAQLVPEEEVCDDEDNNCNGTVDEDLEEACSNACGQGYKVCTEGAWSECVIPDPDEETCDGVDNDCDGTVDEEPSDGSALCGPDDICQDGTCVPLDSGSASGCGCRLDAGSDGSGIVGGLIPPLFALFWLTRRRRRRSV